jgi:AcrR family transcriptional regulator
MTNIVSQRDSPSEAPALPRERPLRADARRNRERILASARAVFSECGNDAQIDDVARRAGVGVGTVYRHFPTKEALMVELVRQKFTVMADRAREVLAQEGEPFERLIGMMRANAEEVHRDAAMQQTLAGFDVDIWAKAEPERDELIRLTGELVESARSAGTIRPDATPYDVGMLMSGLCVSMGQATTGFDWQRHLELVIDSLRPR